MNLIWIKNSEGLQSSIESINQIDKNKFQKLLGHITDNVGERNESGLFTPDELLTLQKVLKLDEDQVALVIKTIRHILKRMSRFVMRPPCLTKDLYSLGIEQEKCLMFVEKYKFLIKNLTEEFNISNFGAIDELKEANWQVNLEMTSSKNQLERCSSVLLDLKTGKSQADKLLIELNEEELKTFQLQLENIQNEVDNVLLQNIK